jgi:AAA domain
MIARWSYAEAEEEINAEAEVRERLVPSGQRLDTPLIRATPFLWTEPAALPQREWVYGHHLIRRFISADIAPGGLGKSSLAIIETLAMVTGRPFLGDRPAGKLRVWLVNLEDPVDELERRIAATALRYEIKPDDIGDRLFVDSGRDTAMAIAIDSREGVQIAAPIVDAIRAEITQKRIDVMIVDPFVASHAVPEMTTARSLPSRANGPRSPRKPAVRSTLCTTPAKLGQIRP